MMSEFSSSSEFDSAPVGRTVLEQEVTAGQEGVDFGRTTAYKEEPLAPEGRTQVSTGSYEGRRTSSGKDDERSGLNVGMSTDMEEDAHASRQRTDVNASDYQGRVDVPGSAHVPTTVTIDDPHSLQSTPVSHNKGPFQTNDGNAANKTFLDGHEGKEGEGMVKLERPKGLEEDPGASDETSHALSASDFRPTKFTDPTSEGGEGVGATSVIKSLDKMNIYGEPEAEKGQKQSYSVGTQNSFSNVAPTGSHDQFSPELSPPSRNTITENLQPVSESSDANRFRDNPRNTITENLQPVSESSDANRFRDNPHDRISDERPSNLSSYMPISGIAQPNPETFGTTKASDHPYSSRDEEPYQSSYTESNPSFQSATADEAISAKKALGSKLGYGQNEDDAGKAERREAVSMEYAAEPQNIPQDRATGHPTNESSYTDKISSATSSIADKAVSAKDTAASKLGYGEMVDAGEQDGGERGLESMDPTGPLKLSQGNETENPKTQSSYGEKISSAASASADKAASAKDAMASKLGHGGKDNAGEQDGGQSGLGSMNPTEPLNLSQGDETENPTTQSSYGEKISSAASAIADKAASAKDAMASKPGYGEEDAGEIPVRGGEARDADQDGSSYENPTKQSSYTEKISSSTAAVADKAVSGKNVVASNLGYGEKDDEGGRETEGAHGAGSGSAMEFGKKIASTVAEKLSPVYAKVAGAGGAVMSKVQGGGNETYTTTPTVKETESSAGEQDKGLSMKGYWAEKLKPGEEDKALSDLISEKLNNSKEKPGEAAPGESQKPMGKVTESEEVKRRLGTDEDSGDGGGDKTQSTYVNSPGSSVVDKLKGAMSSWFGGGGGETKTPQQPSDSSHGDDENSSDSTSVQVRHHTVLEGEKTPQESGQ